MILWTEGTSALLATAPASIVTASAWAESALACRIAIEHVDIGFAKAGLDRRVDEDRVSPIPFSSVTTGSILAAGGTSPRLSTELAPDGPRWIFGEFDTALWLESPSRSHRSAQGRWA